MSDDRSRSKLREQRILRIGSGPGAVEGCCPSRAGASRKVSPKSIQRDGSENDRPRRGQARKRLARQSPCTPVHEPPRGEGPRCGSILDPSSESVEKATWLTSS